MSLVKRFTAADAPRRPGSDQMPGGAEESDGMIMGVRLADGTGMLLDSQPLPAISKGWGNLAFLHQGRRH